MGFTWSSIRWTAQTSAPAAFHQCAIPIRLGRHGAMRKVAMINPCHGCRGAYGRQLGRLAGQRTQLLVTGQIRATSPRPASAAPR